MTKMEILPEHDKLRLENVVPIYQTKGGKPLMLNINEATDRIIGYALQVIEKDLENINMQDEQTYTVRWNLMNDYYEIMKKTVNYIVVAI